MKIFKSLYVILINCIIVKTFNLQNIDLEKLNMKKFNVKSMNFNLNKDSLWISYTLNCNFYNKINKMIPDTHKLTKCRIFEEDKKDYRLFFNIFEVNTPFFTGNRLEVVTLAKEKLTQDISFVVIDCFTNSMHWDPINGIQKANSKFNKLINNHKYNIKINDNNNNIIFDLKSSKGKIRKSVLKSFSIYPNYKCFFKNFTTGYTLSFNEKQVDQKVLLINNYHLENIIYKEYLKELEHIFIYTNRMNFKVYL